MVELTPPVRKRLDADFGMQAQRLIAALEALPESINSGQDPERVQAAVVLAAQGSGHRLGK